MKPKTHLENLTLIKSLFESLATLEVDESIVYITVQNDNILELIAKDFSAHIYKPFESGSNEQSHCWVIKGKMSIKVLSADKFRKETILKAY